MEPEDWGDDDARSMLPPVDRIWRHPSEVGAFSALAAPAGWPALAAHHPGRRAAVVAGVVGLATAGVLLSLATGLRVGRSAPAVSAEQVVPRLLVVSTTVFLPAHQASVAWLGISTDDDVAVSGVDSESPAATAGLRPGDVIVAVDGVTVSSMAQVVKAIHRHRPGDVCRLDIVRDGERLTVVAILGALG